MLVHVVQDGVFAVLFARDRLRAIAQEAGVNAEGYDSCVASGEHQAATRSETMDAIAAGVDSTPTLVINGRTIAGVPSVAQLTQLINEAAASAITR